ncbi:MAG: hypothetical protein D6679_05640, partial [Candidatus Hydrogenedentota bacterium]
MVRPSGCSETEERYEGGETMKRFLSGLAATLFFVAMAGMATPTHAKEEKGKRPEVAKEHGKTNKEKEGKEHSERRLERRRKENRGRKEEHRYQGKGSKEWRAHRGRFGHRDRGLHRGWRKGEREGEGREFWGRRRFRRMSGEEGREGRRRAFGRRGRFGHRDRGLHRGWR